MTTQEELQLRIRDLEKEVARLHSQIKNQRYGLVWLDVPEAFDQESENKIPILEEIKDKAIHTLDGKPTHILIEGDNYHALTCLNYTHRGKIDVIYIDPPYNTGNDGFTYKDKRFLKEYPGGESITKDHPLRHSAWLSFMNKRLKLAKNLLSERGVIFISIDDNEQAQLKLLCDEIFGEENFIAEMIWQQGKKHIGTFIGINHEYMIVYARKKELINDNTKKWKQRKEGLDKIYAEYAKLQKKYNTDYERIGKEMDKFYKSLPESSPAYSSKHYNKVDARGIFFAADISQGTGNGPRYEVFHPVTGKPVCKPTGGWRYSYETMQKLLEEDRILFGADEKKVPCRKRYLKETEYELPSSVFYKDGRGATKEVEGILGAKFNNPKDRYILQQIINFRENSTILDFFAGSGTTLHATMQLNEEDGGNRQCILVQQQEEKRICETITYVRNKRVMQGYTNPKGEEIPGLGNSLKYYRTAFVGENPAQEASDTDKTLLAQKAGCLLALGENTLDEINRNEHYQLFSDGKRLTAIYFTEDARWLDDFVAELEQWHSEHKGAVCAYIFSWSDGEEYISMLEHLPRTEIKSIPQPILEIYKKLYS